MTSLTLAIGRPLLGDDAEVLALPLAPGTDGPIAGPGTAEAAKALGLDLTALAVREKATGAVGEIVTIPITGSDGPEQVLLVGVGKGSTTDLRRVGAAVARRVRTRKKVSTTLGMSVTPEGLRALVEGIALGSYSFGLRSGPQKPQSAGAITLHVKGSEKVLAAAGSALDRGQVTAAAVCLARDLANTPSAKKTPAWLADQAVAVAKKAGLGVTVWEPERLAKEGFGGLLAVGGGAAPRRGPRFIELTYQPAGAAEGPHIVVVGKGITFDSGGLSLKPNDGMVAMKADMAGGAAVIGAMSALRALEIPVRVTGLVAAAENMPSGSAYRPGDVIRHYGGRTVEVLNTDAEGRLVLADALAYADATLNPDLVVDLATLTGAATLALTRRIGALFSNDERLASALLAAADSSGDRLWRLPLTEDYRWALESPVADLAHVPRDRKVQGGAITAALFLREFAGARRWAHIDMAGPGKIDADEHENTKGGTGYGVRLLLRWLETYRR